jgi:microcystin-dependent protein
MALKNGRTTTSLQTVIIGSVIPTGTVQSFAGVTVPDGWLLCDGSTISRTTYSALFEVISTLHGEGDATTTFHLPDLRGRFLRGADDMGTGAAGRDPDAAARTAANAGGATGNAVGSVQADENKPHEHFTVVNALTAGAAISASNYLKRQSADAESGNGYAYNLRGLTTPPTVGRTSKTGISESRPQNANTSYIIKV